jgi:hypothetical protein
LAQIWIRWKELWSEDVSLQACTFLWRILQMAFLQMKEQKVLGCTGQVCVKFSLNSL